MKYDRMDIRHLVCHADGNNNQFWNNWRHGIFRSDSMPIFGFIRHDIEFAPFNRIDVLRWVRIVNKTEWGM
jgi:hypothetical protein